MDMMAQSPCDSVLGLRRVMFCCETHTYIWRLPCRERWALFPGVLVDVFQELWRRPSAFTMRFTRQASIFLSTATVFASYDGNLNFRSPSLTHAGLGIDMPRLQSRMIQKRDGPEYENDDLSFTHGIASVSSGRLSLV